jgi:hypothetical protein
MPSFLSALLGINRSFFFRPYPDVLIFSSFLLLRGNPIQIVSFFVNLVFVFYQHCFGRFLLSLSKFLEFV